VLQSKQKGQGARRGEREEKRMRQFVFFTPVVSCWKQFSIGRPHAPLFFLFNFWLADKVFHPYFCRPSFPCSHLLEAKETERRVILVLHQIQSINQSINQLVFN